MGVLNNPPHLVEVKTKVEVKGTYGTTLKPGPVYVVPGALQPINTTEAGDLGLGVATTYRFICKDEWPGGPTSEITVLVGPPGVTLARMDQHGDARGYSTGSRRMHRQDVLLRMIDGENR